MWRAENPNTKEYTWRNTDHTIRTRIDRIYTPTNLKNQTTTKTRNTCTQEPLAQGNDLRMQIFSFSPLFKKH